jgi:hypothetical protein
MLNPLQKLRLLSRRNLDELESKLGSLRLEVCSSHRPEIGYITPKDMFAGYQHEIQAERDRKLEAAREQRKNRRQRVA